MGTEGAAVTGAGGAARGRCDGRSRWRVGEEAAEWELEADLRWKEWWDEGRCGVLEFVYAFYMLKWCDQSYSIDNERSAIIEPLRLKWTLFYF